MLSMEIQYDDKYWNETTAFARKCSWQGSGTALTEMMENNEFISFERVFTIIENNKPIGFCTLTKRIKHEMIRIFHG